jgi:hypothetical protein
MIALIGLPLIIVITIFAYWIWEKRASDIPAAGFYDNFEDPQYLGSFNADQLMIWRSNTNDRDQIIQLGDSTMMISVAENEALILMMPKHVNSFRLSAPTLCQTTMRLDIGSRLGNIALEIPAKKKNGIANSKIRYKIESRYNSGNQQFMCHSTSDDVNLADSPVVDIVDGSWHLVGIELYPQEFYFRVHLDGKVVYRSPVLDSFSNSIFDCRIQVHNYSGSGVYGYFEDFQIKEIEDTK